MIDRRSSHSNLNISKIYTSTLQKNKCCEDCQLCPYINIEYSMQLTLKQETIEKTLNNLIKTDSYTLLNIQKSPKKDNYRNNARLTFQYSTGGKFLRMGMKSAYDYQFSDLTHCPLHSDTANKALRLIARAIKENNLPILPILPIYDPPNKTDVIKEITLKTSKLGVRLLLIWHTSATNHETSRQLKEVSRKLKKDLPRLETIIQMIDHQEVKTLVGKGHIYDEILNQEFKLSPHTNMITNTLQLENIARRFIELASFQKSGKILHLFANTGIFSILLSEAGHRVPAVDHNDRSIEEAKENRKHNKIRTNFICQKIDAYLEDINQNKSESPPFDLVLLTPPKTGLSAYTINLLIKLSSPNIIIFTPFNDKLISDLNLMTSAYQIKTIEPFDVLPQTKLIETIILLKKSL